MKKIGFHLLLFNCALAVFSFTSFLLNFHPSGYAFSVTDSIVEVTKGIMSPQKIQFPISDANAVSLIKIEMAIIKLVNHWLIYSVFLSILIAGILGFFKLTYRFNLNLITYTIIYTFVFIIVIAVGFDIFNDHITYIDTLVK
ncbi:hypothetical protein JFL43_17070 [Viridibacillus sp. YIM B01967]|uniref:Uncharacterized protein n=1 Tax=Viridibacillus soli TaxID=2798301 RepID=A0ABS1HAR6_9BACL|nr:hypothetical protein [Viridibacillus soli]MBK3496538.1 hypothetical protein [Viridibacillus soli]